MTSSDMPGKMRQTPVWDVMSLGIVVLGFLVQMFQWWALPRFMDVYYHLSVARGFEQAGGYVTHAFWEYAPVGRPHLYPPLVHILMVLFLKMGVPVLAVGKLMEAVIFPAMLATVWAVTRKLCSSRAALFAVVMVFSSVSVYLSVSILVPFSLSMILGLLAFLAFEKEKRIAAALLLGLSFYAHAFMAVLSLHALGLYGVVMKRHRRAIVPVLGGAAVAWAPFAAYLLAHKDFMQVVRLRENWTLEIDVLVWLLAAVGLSVAVRRKGAALFGPCFLVAMLWLGKTHLNRFVEAHGMIPVVILAGIGLDAACRWVASAFRRRGPATAFGVVTVLVLLVVGPIVHVNMRGETRPVFFDRLITHYRIPESRRISRPKEFSIYNMPEEYGRVAQLVRAHSEEDDIIWSDFEYGGGIVALLSDRATSSAMVREVEPYGVADRQADAKVLVWFKSPSRGVWWSMRPAVDRLGLVRLGETDLAHVWLNPSGGRKVVVSPPLVPLWVATVLLLVVTAGIFWDVLRRRRGISSS